MGAVGRGVDAGRTQTTVCEECKGVAGRRVYHGFGIRPKLSVLDPLSIFTYSLNKLLLRIKSLLYACTAFLLATDQR